MLSFLDSLVVGQLRVVAHQILDQAEGADVRQSCIAQHLIPLINLDVPTLAQSHLPAILGKVD